MIDYDKVFNNIQPCYHGGYDNKFDKRKTVTDAMAVYHAQKLYQYCDSKQGSCAGCIFQSTLPPYTCVIEALNEAEEYQRLVKESEE